MKCIAIIPARGGSKRLPKKNIMLLKKLPLLVHSINYCKANSFIDEIYVSTDDFEIKQIAIKNGVKVIDRPQKLSGDESTTVSALKHVLETIGEEKKSNVVLLQVTNPLRPRNLLQEAYQKFIEEDYDSLMTVTRNYDKLGKIESGSYIPFNYKMGQRSQDLDPLYYENGLLYITKSELILKDKILGDNNYPFVVNHPFSKVDIDTLEDFKYAQFVLDNYKDE